MTEQEKKENSVDKMAYCILGKDGRTKLSTRDWLITNYILRKLYDEGYRREEEVRKEVFREIAKKLVHYIDKKFLKDLFGVEVEE